MTKKFLFLSAMVLMLASCGNADNALEEIINGGGEGSTPAAPTIDLSTITEATTIQDGYTLTGTIGANVKITIADGATVTLDGVTINGTNDENYKWAGITCEGDATIILKDGSTNTVKGFYKDYPGIYMPEDKTLIIKGTGSLMASPFDGGNTSNSLGAGIGGGNNIPCGNIVIESGTVTATGGYEAAGIGSGRNANCGNITISGGDITSTGCNGAAGIGSGHSSSSCGAINISGGTITANGGFQGAGIGSGASSSTCGAITITAGVTSVTAKKGTYAPNSIGPGDGSTCGAVSIGGMEYWSGTAYKNSGNPYLIVSPLNYPASATIATSKALSAVTATELGWYIGSDGKAYNLSTGSLPTGVTAIALITYVGDGDTSEGDHNNGLALALEDVSTQKDWCSQSASYCLGIQYLDGEAAKGDKAGYDNTYHNCSHGARPAATAAQVYNGGTHPTETSKWFLPSVGQWDIMATAAGSYLRLKNNAGLKSGTIGYWASTEYDAGMAWYINFQAYNWSSLGKQNPKWVRAAIAF